MQNRNRLTATRNKLVDPPPGGSRLEASSSEKTQAARYLTGSARWGPGGKRRTAPGESAPKPLAAWAARRVGKRRAASRESVPKPLAA